MKQSIGQTIIDAIQARQAMSEVQLQQIRVNIARSRHDMAALKVRHALTMDFCLEQIASLRDLQIRAFLNFENELELLQLLQNKAA